jgi:hypothetical protein
MTSLSRCRCRISRQHGLKNYGGVEFIASTDPGGSVEFVAHRFALLHVPRDSFRLAIGFWLL